MQIMVQYMMLEVVELIKDKQVEVVLPRWIPVLLLCFAKRLLMLVQAGLIVESCSRWHFGTTYVIKARPPPQNM